MDISIHAPSRERQQAVSAGLLYGPYFNPRSLTGATLRHLLLYLLYCHFNPRSLTGATKSAHLLRLRQRYFNPRSLTGATLRKMLQAVTFDISIHAPSRERRRVRCHNFYVYIISIHAPSRERHKQTSSNNKLFEISIHAPSRERPQELQAAQRPNFDFNPRSLTGATAGLVARLPTTRFQSTLPHGSDRAQQLIVVAYRKFQSTLPHGSDICLSSL